ncbi:MAG: aminoglycoside phosphotransferase [Actinomycetota bacterium]|nr:aminoglycoside phosphotransferase [Actinomycetota bacterium]
MIHPDDLVEELRHFLPRQRWFGGKDHPIQKVVPHKMQILRLEWPGLLRVEIDVFSRDLAERYQFLLGLRPAGVPSAFLDQNPDAVMRLFETEAGPAYGYDATRDRELGIELFKIVMPEAELPSRVEPIGAEQSNSSLVYDDKLIFKIFRRLSSDPNPDLEVTQALGRVGFEHVPVPVAVWKDGDIELGLIQPYLRGVDGWAMALTSLRDLYWQGGDPAEAGGDFAAESQMLGMTVAKMHEAMAEAFGRWPGDPKGWGEAMESQLDRIAHPLLDKHRAHEVFHELESLDDPGSSIRVHGDLHLGQALRTDAGWYLLDFEGEPARPREERRQATSPLKDVAGMLRSFHYAAWSGMAASELKLVEPGQAWEERNRTAFLNGYREVARRADGLLPQSEVSLELVLKAFELDRGIYEIGYEMANRPAWVEVPLAAVASLY